MYGRRSSSNPNVVRGCVCKCQYDSAIWDWQINFRKHLREGLRILTAWGSSLASSCSSFQAFVRGISMIPSMITWETCTPFGPNSRARDCANARRANFPVAKAEKLADPFRLPVAPVKIKVGGWGSSFASRSRGRVPLAKRYPPFLLHHHRLVSHIFSKHDVTYPWLS